MTDETTHLTIGQLARRTGLSVRTIRFYSDSGVVPEVDRTDAGYRLYDVTALARLELVRTLRDLGVDLATIRRVLARELALSDVAATHAAAIDAQIRTLRLRRAVLRAVASSTSEAEEIQLMSELTALSDEERRRIVRDFVDETFAGIDPSGEVEAKMRAVEPQLPDDPTPEQVEAWVELAQLVRDPSFRERARAMAEQGRDGGEGDPDGVTTSPAAGKLIGTRAGAAVADGVDPAGPEGQAILEELLADLGEPDDRRALGEQVAAFTDARVERYWQLLGVINGWPPAPSVTPAWTWFADALRAHPRA